MALQPVPTTPEARAEALAKNIIDLITRTAKQINQIRAGIPATEARLATTGPNGQQIPAVAAQPAVSKELLDSKLGTANVAILDGIATQLGL